MTVEELRLAFAKNLKNLMDSYDYTQEDVAKVCGTSRQIVSEWLNGKKYPRMDKVQAILDHFNIPLSALINDGKQDTTLYYLNPETAKLAQEVYDNPDLRILFDASRDLRPEDIRFVIGMVNRMKCGENNE